MLDLMLSVLITALLIGSSCGGYFLYRFLSENHRSQASMDFVRLVAGLLTTFTALILGLLLSEVNSDFNTVQNDMRSFGSEFISLNDEMSAFGPRADSTRRLLQEYLRSVVVETWPDEQKPRGDYMVARIDPHSSPVDAANLGDLLLEARHNLRLLDPMTEVEKSAKTGCLTLMSDILDRRRRLISEAHASISSPLLVMMVLWLMVVFASFGVTAPRHAFSAVWIGLVALSVGGAIFSLLELDGPLDGFIRVSSEPIRGALYYLEKPTA